MRNSLEIVRVPRSCMLAQLHWNIGPSTNIYSMMIHTYNSLIIDRWILYGFKCMGAVPLNNQFNVCIIVCASKATHIQITSNNAALSIHRMYRRRSGVSTVIQSHWKWWQLKLVDHFNYFSSNCLIGNAVDATLQHATYRSMARHVWTTYASVPPHLNDRVVRNLIVPILPLLCVASCLHKPNSSATKRLCAHI